MEESPTSAAPNGAEDELHRAEQRRGHAGAVALAFHRQHAAVKGMIAPISER